MHIYRPWQKNLQSLSVGIKLYEELRSQGTHRLSSNACRKKGNNSTRRTPTEKRKKTGAAYFHATAIYNITKTHLYSFDPLKRHFYTVKLGFTGVYIIFLISAQK